MDVSTVVALGLAVVAVALAVYFWARPRQYAKLRFATYSVNLVKYLKSQLEGLTVTT